MNRLSSGNLVVSFFHSPHVQSVKFSAQALFTAIWLSLGEGNSRGSDILQGGQGQEKTIALFFYSESQK